MDQNMNMGEQVSEEKKPIGSIISIIVIVLVLALGAYYFLRQVPAPASLTSDEIQVDTTISALSEQGTSTDISDIQKDLNATDLSGIEAGLGDITF